MAQKYQIHLMTRSDAVFTNDLRPIVSFKPDGSIQIGEGYTPTEAGDDFLEALKAKGVYVHHDKPATHALLTLTSIMGSHYSAGPFMGDDRVIFEQAIEALKRLATRMEGWDGPDGAQAE